MKKALKIILIVLAIVLLLPRLLVVVALAIATATNYTDTQRDDAGFVYLTREKNKKAAVCGYVWDPESGDNVVTIPESFGAYPVKGLGGYVGRGAPSLFVVEIKDLGSRLGVGLSGGSFPRKVQGKAVEVVYVDLALNIGPNIREIHAASDDAFLSDGKLYAVRLYVNCDPANPKFYSEDGVLYQKNGQPVKGFLYWNRDY